ncbi:NosD domain-containing protein [Nanoarchaeota archaeon]
MKINKLLIVSFFVMMSMVFSVSAINCNTTISSDITLTEDLDCRGQLNNGGTGIVMLGSGQVLDCGGYSIIGVNPENDSTAINVIGRGIEIINCTFTGWAAGVNMYGDNLIIRDNTFNNVGVGMIGGGSGTSIYRNIINDYGHDSNAGFRAAIVTGGSNFNIGFDPLDPSDSNNGNLMGEPVSGDSQGISLIYGATGNVVMFNTGRSVLIYEAEGNIVQSNDLNAVALIRSHSNFIDDNDLDATGFPMGVQTDGATWNNITNNRITGSALSSIGLAHATNYNRVIGNTVSGGASSLWIRESDNNHIEGNSFTDPIQTRNIYIDASSYNTLVDNDITNSPLVNIDLDKISTFNTLSGNRISGSRVGITIGADNYGNVVDQNNVITGDNNAGIVDAGICDYSTQSGNTITANTISQHNYGILFASSSFSTESANTITVVPEGNAKVAVSMHSCDVILNSPPSNPGFGEGRLPEEAESCCDGIDNDGDGLIDQQDTEDCHLVTTCGSTQCVNTVQMNFVEDGQLINAPYGVAFLFSENEIQTGCGIDTSGGITMEVLQGIWGGCASMRGTCMDFSGGSCTTDIEVPENDNIVAFAFEYWPGSGESGPGSSEGECSDGQDNDQDGLVDCDDPHCGGVCDGDNKAGAALISANDCQAGSADIISPIPPAGGGQEICNDGQDNDQDGMVDCQDPDCGSDPSCGGPQELQCQPTIMETLDNLQISSGNSVLIFKYRYLVEELGIYVDDGIDMQEWGLIMQDFQNTPEGQMPSVLSGGCFDGPTDQNGQCVAQLLQGVSYGDVHVVVAVNSMGGEVPLEQITSLIVVYFPCGSRLTLDYGRTIGAPGGPGEGGQPGTCNDGQDNDQDGAVDCEDDECWEAPECQGPEPGEGGQPGTCNDGQDNDQDGAVDCEDDECWGAPECQGPQFCTGTINVQNSQGAVDGALAIALDYFELTAIGVTPDDGIDMVDFGLILQSFGSGGEGPPATLTGGCLDFDSSEPFILTQGGSCDAVVFGDKIEANHVVVAWTFEDMSNPFTPIQIGSTIIQPFPCDGNLGVTIESLTPVEECPPMAIEEGAFVLEREISDVAISVLGTDLYYGDPEFQGDLPKIPITVWAKVNYTKTSLFGGDDVNDGGVHDQLLEDVYGISRISIGAKARYEKCNKKQCITKFSIELDSEEHPERVLLLKDGDTPFTGGVYNNLVPLQELLDASGYIDQETGAISIGEGYLIFAYEFSQIGDGDEDFNDLVLLVQVGPKSNVCITGEITDDDGDGVPNSEDLCPGTDTPEEVPTEIPDKNGKAHGGYLLPNHYAQLDADPLFEVKIPIGLSGEIVDSEFSLFDTHGCSCEQIIDRKSGAGQDKNDDKRFGCSKGMIQGFADDPASFGVTGAVIGVGVGGSDLVLVVSIIALVAIVAIVLMESKKPTRRRR